jgi:hypothetical protein
MSSLIVISTFPQRRAPHEGNRRNDALVLIANCQLPAIVLIEAQQNDAARANDHQERFVEQCRPALH